MKPLDKISMLFILILYFLSERVSQPLNKRFSQIKNPDMKIVIIDDGKFNYDSMGTDCCIFDPKVTLFGTFQVGWTTFDVGSDSIQVFDYYKQQHYR